jgi:hypothetical protein
VSGGPADANRQFEERSYPVAPWFIFALMIFAGICVMVPPSL